MGNDPANQIDPSGMISTGSGAGAYYFTQSSYTRGGEEGYQSSTNFLAVLNDPRTPGKGMLASGGDGGAQGKSTSVDLTALRRALDIVTSSTSGLSSGVAEGTARSLAGQVVGTLKAAVNPIPMLLGTAQSMTPNGIADNTVAASLLFMQYENGDEYTRHTMQGYLFGMIVGGILGSRMMPVPIEGVAIKAAGNAAKGGEAFFEGASYSPKVVKQMGKTDDIFHAFPKSADGFATKFGKSSIQVGADGKPYQWLKMDGSYRDKTGTFEYIKDANGIINHRFFNVPKVP